MARILASLSSPKRSITIYAHEILGAPTTIEITGWFKVKEQGSAKDFLHIKCNVMQIIVIDLAKLFPEIIEYGEGMITSLELPEGRGGDLKYGFGGHGSHYNLKYSEISTNLDPLIDESIVLSEYGR